MEISNTIKTTKKASSLLPLDPILSAPAAKRWRWVAPAKRRRGNFAFRASSGAISTHFDGRDDGRINRDIDAS